MLVRPLEPAGAAGSFGSVTRRTPSSTFAERRALSTLGGRRTVRGALLARALLAVERAPYSA